MEKNKYKLSFKEIIKNMILVLLFCFALLVPCLSYNCGYRDAIINNISNNSITQQTNVNDTPKRTITPTLSQFTFYNDKQFVATDSFNNYLSNFSISFNYTGDVLNSVNISDYYITYDNDIYNGEVADVNISFDLLQNNFYFDDYNVFYLDIYYTQYQSTRYYVVNYMLTIEDINGNSSEFMSTQTILLNVYELQMFVFNRYYEFNLNDALYDSLLESEYEQGKFDGYEIGYKVGFDDGKDTIEQTTSLFDYVFNLLEKGASVLFNVFSVELFPNVPLFYLLGVPFMVVILLFVLKVVKK